MKRVLVTGASGFIGRHCVDALARLGRWEIHAVRSPGSVVTPGPGVDWHAVDLLDARDVRPLVKDIRADALLHLAWHVAMDAPENYRWVAASLNLLMDFAEAGGRRAVLAGSCAEYDWHTTEPLHEGARLAPASHYGACKQHLAALVARYAPSAGIQAAWARIFFVYGPFEAAHRLVPAVARALLEGRPAATTHGRQRRDYLYVEDLADALVRLLESDLSGPVNVASGRPVALATLTGLIAAELGRPDLLRPGALDAPANEPAELSADIGRLARELDWTPAFTHEQGLSRTVAWWRRGGQP